MHAGHRRLLAGELLHPIAEGRSIQGEQAMKTTESNPSRSTLQLSVLVAGVAAIALAAAPAWADYGYSYFRTVEGYADLEAAGDGSSLEALENHPLVAGDLLRVGSNSRVEVLLSDGALLRIGGGSDIRFDSLAWTPDTDDTVSRLVLLEGEVQVVLGSDFEGQAALEIDTSNATLFLEGPGEYRLTARDYGATEIVVRDGFAEAQTDRGSAIVRAGEVGYIDGNEWATVEIARAGGLDALEYWGDDLDAEARLAEAPYVEPELRYRAARMANYGAWIDVGGRHGWRPRVAVGWRPYVSGSWVYTPSGLTWVSSEPWGWVPSHYGSWDLVPGYGWVWFAGGYYSPAWVYWYWGPSHVAWVPSGYYTGFYSPYYQAGFGPRFGIYGWAGGNWGFFAEWTFCPTRYFGRSGYHEYFRSGREVGSYATYRELPRGVIATDTRSVSRDVWGQPEQITARLTAADTRLAAGDLPDVTDFVARRREIRPEIADMVRPARIQAASRADRKATTVRPRLDDGRNAPASPRFDERRAAVGRSIPDDAARQIERRADLAPRVDRGTAAYARPDSSPSSRPAPRIEPRYEPAPRSDRDRYDRPETRWESTRPPAYDRPDVDRSRDIDRERSGIRERTYTPSSGSDRFSFGSRDSDRFTAPPRGSDSSVVQKVIEQMRSQRVPTAAPTSASSAPATPSSRPDLRASTPPSRGTTSGTVTPPQPPSRSSVTARPPSPPSRASATKPPSRSSASRSRKPPNGN